MILRNCRVLPELTDDFYGTEADVRIAGARIAALCPPGELPREADEVDAEGKTLLPGLIEAHAHLSLSSQSVLEMSVEDPATAAFRAYAFAKEYLRQGYTTVRDCGSSDGVASAVRNAHRRRDGRGPADHLLRPDHYADGNGKTTGFR